MKRVKYLPSDGNSLAEKLRKYRLQAGFSQENIARQLNVSRSAYTYYEMGTTSPDPATLNRIAKIFKVPLEDFFSSEESELAAKDSESLPPRPPRKPKPDPKRIGELSSGERNIIAFLRDKDISPEDALEVLQKLDKRN